ncbi:MAG TPA: DNRLRE domain-containing protein [Planctomycetota bacterium]
MQLLHPVPHLVLALLVTPLAAQTTVTVPCAADNTLYESPTGALSNGAGPSIFAGTNATTPPMARRALVRFDVAASVPAGATILSASLSVNVVQTTAFPPIPVAVHRVLQSWGEGTSVSTLGQGGQGAPATTNDATWLHRFWPSTLWTAAGGDFAPAPSFTIVTPAFGTGTSPISPGTVTDVQFWLNNPAQNFGWLLKTDELLASTARRMDSRENSVGTPPSLSVTYVVPGQLATWGTGCPVGAGTFGFSYVGSPVGGTTIQLVNTNAPPLTVGAVFFSLQLDPIGLPLLPGCTIYLPLTGLITGPIFVTDGAGNGSAPFGVPFGFPGFIVVAQSLALAPSPLGFLLSNAAVADLL